MTRRLIIIFAGLLMSLSVSRPVLGAGESYLLIVTGLAGEPQYGDRFYEWAAAMQSAATKRLGLAEDHVWHLGESPERDPERISAKSTKDNIQRAFDEIARRVRPGDQVIMLLIGHGSFRSGQSRFNLPGPDITPAELAVILDRFSTQKVVLINTASASGDFVKSLSGPNRVVVTATKTGLERNETVFGGYFVKAFAEEGADVNKDDRVSILEAFEFARLEVERFYQEQNRLQTEHAVLDDDGDGMGTHDSVESAGNGDGRLAASFFLSGSGRGMENAVSEDPELTALYEQAKDLEDRIEVLKQQKDAMSPDLYLEELEKLLLELAQKKGAIRELEQKVKERTQSW